MDCSQPGSSVHGILQARILEWVAMPSSRGSSGARDQTCSLWLIPFPTVQSVVPCPVLTVASWPAYRLLKRQVRWSGIPISFRIFQFVVIHTVKGFDTVNKAEVDVFLELSCFFNDPADVDNLNSGSSAFSKTNLNIRKFMAHILLKPGLENFEHYFTSAWDECHCACCAVGHGVAKSWTGLSDWTELNWSWKLSLFYWKCACEYVSSTI